MRCAFVIDLVHVIVSHRCVPDFLQWPRSENGTASDEITEFLFSNDNTINEYHDRYLSTGEDLVAIISDFLSNDQTSLFERSPFHPAYQRE